jgi:hypothetical protein
MAILVMECLVMEWRNVKSCLLRLNLGPILSISGAALAVGCIAMGFYRLAVILAGMDLILTRLALGALRRPKNDNPTPSR